MRDVTHFTEPCHKFQRQINSETIRQSCLVSRFMVVGRAVRGVPVGVAGLAMVMVVMVAALVARVVRRVYVRHHQLGAVLGRLALMAAVRVLGPGRLV